MKVPSSFSGIEIKIMYGFKSEPCLPGRDFWRPERVEAEVNANVYVGILLKTKEPSVKPVPTREGEIRIQMALKGRARLGISHPSYLKT